MMILLSNGMEKMQLATMLLKVFISTTPLVQSLVEKSLLNKGLFNSFVNNWYNQLNS